MLHLYQTYACPYIHDKRIYTEQVFETSDPRHEFNNYEQNKNKIK